MSSNSKFLVLQSNDGQIFQVEESLATAGSVTLKHIVGDGCANEVIPLHNVSSNSLGKIIAYWRHHAQGDDDESEEKKAEMKNWDEEFVKMDVDDPKKFELIMAANYLDAKQILELLCVAIGEIMKDMSVEEVRDFMGIKNDFSPEEEQEIRAQYAWAFENN